MADNSVEQVPYRRYCVMTLNKWKLSFFQNVPTLIACRLPSIGSTEVIFKFGEIVFFKKNKKTNKFSSHEEK